MPFIGASVRRGPLSRYVLKSRSQGLFASFTNKGSLMRNGFQALVVAIFCAPSIVFAQDSRAVVEFSEMPGIVRKSIEVLLEQTAGAKYERIGAPIVTDVAYNLRMLTLASAQTRQGSPSIEQALESKAANVDMLQQLFFKRDKDGTWTFSHLGERLTAQAA